MENPIRVLVVDDSAFMRSAIKGMIQSDPKMQVVATARDGEEALDRVRKFRPDVVTMDIEMPRMNGLEAIRHIMAENPLPILVVSSLAENEAHATLDALASGAADFICKNLESRSMNIMNLQEELIAKLRTIAKDAPTLTLPKSIIKPSLTQLSVETKAQMKGNVLTVAIGASTGGPKALQEVIPYLPKELSASVVIVQHMPPTFTKAFAERLNTLSALEVKEAVHGEVLQAGKVLVAQGGRHLRLFRSRLEVVVEVSDVPHNLLYKPSVNEMMVSAAKAYGGRVLGVIMTGMGNDGCIGMKEIKDHGGKTIAQDEKSCVVYGMPKAVVDEGLQDKIVPLNSLANEITNMI